MTARMDYVLSLKTELHGRPWTLSRKLKSSPGGFRSWGMWFFNIFTFLPKC